MFDNPTKFFSRLKTATVITLMLLACQQVSQNQSDSSFLGTSTTNPASNYLVANSK
ncbi:MAG: hypothetical protein QNJ54_16955 [Prochloraceae cyanobacterium]|nr:hypothetical protein [Prochloraceae cyanobacterium]